VKSAKFTRLAGGEGLGRLSEAVGAAFDLPVATVSKPIKTHDGIFIERVDMRVVADSAAWEKQKEGQRMQLTNQIRQQRIRQFLTNLRESAKIVDNRKEVESANRRTSSQ